MFANDGSGNASSAQAAAPGCPRRTHGGDIRSLPRSGGAALKDAAPRAAGARVAFNLIRERLQNPT